MTVIPRGQAEQRYESLLRQLFECKNAREFELLLQKIIDFLDVCKYYPSLQERSRIYINDYWVFNYIMAHYYSVCLFDVVLMKNKKLLPFLKKHNIKYVNSRFTYPPVYDHLMNRDIDTVDYIVANGYDIIDEDGYCFYDCGRQDGKDMVDLLIDMKNTTSIKYIYEHTSIGALQKYYPNKHLFKYVYEHLLPF